jgi:predicted ATPase
MAANRPLPLHVVLFGPAGAGKTTLLSALAEAVRGESPASVGKASQGLASTTSAPTTSTVMHSITFEPEPGHMVPVELLDCPGKEAERLLAGDLTAPGAEQDLANAVVQAEVLVLPIDATASPDRLDELFTSFTRFLEALEEARGERVEVSGLPVFLVLTHCDQLAQPNDTLVSWLERIEEEKRTVEGRFREFLTRTWKEPGGRFGDIRLRLWATAIRRPSLVGSPARTEEPFGVADLFRQCCEEGLAYRAAQHHSSRRLALALAGVGGLVLFLLVLSIGLLFQKQPRPRSPLEQSIEALRFGDRPTAGQRLDEKSTVLEARLAQLSEIRADPGFGQLPEEKRAWVLVREEELSRYLQIRDQVLARQPAEASSLEELVATRKALTGLELPADWATTEVANERARLVEEANRLRQAAEQAMAWFDRSSAEAGALLRADQYRGRAIVWNQWYKEAQALATPRQGPGARPAPRAEDLIEGTQGLHQGLVLTYPEVVRKVSEWTERKKALEQTMQVVAELGLVRLPGRKQPLLVFGDDFTLAGADQRLKELREQAPLLLEPGLRLDALGPGQEARAELDARAREQYQFLLGLERQVLEARFKEYDPTTSTESKARWAFVGEGLPPGGDLAPAWVKLAGLLARLQDPPAPTDPVNDLRSFLRTDQGFPLWARTLRLEIPPSVGVAPLPGARLRIFLGSPDKPASDATEVMVFDLVEALGGPPQTATYLFQRKDRGSMIYLPRSPLRAELVLEKGERFTWNLSRTDSYQFEALQLEPWKHRDGSAPETGTREKHVQLRVLDQSATGDFPAWPRVPDLLPDVRGVR